MTQFRRCKKCGNEKLLIDFDFYDKSKGLRRHECRYCHRIRMNIWFLAHKEQMRERAAERYRKEPSRVWSKEKKARAAATAKKFSRGWREVVIRHYGGKCSCCGEDNPGFLTIDHKNGCGTKKRKLHGVGLRFYRWIIKNGYPDDLQILCYNCNCGRELNGGICPHHGQGRLNDYPEREYAASDWQRKRPEPSSH